MIGVMDLGLGNLRSVANAIDSQGFDPCLLDDPAAGPWSACSHLILPGVGSFAVASSRLTAAWRAAIGGHVAAGRPLLGICLGMQLLADAGSEGGESAGLGLIPGRVDRLEAPGLRLPQVGWNGVRLLRSHPLTAALKPDRDMYFVHSYGFRTTSPEDVLATTDYGGPVTAAVARGCVVGYQFHPEKSQVNGLGLLAAFCDWDGRC
jgi:glutamine amidotransferase